MNSEHDWSPLSLHFLSSLFVQGACMAAQLLAACFSCSLIHPQRAVDFATYTPVDMWEGTHLFHDPYRYAPAVPWSDIWCHCNILQQWLSDTA